MSGSSLDSATQPPNPNQPRFWACLLLGVYLVPLILFSLFAGQWSAAYRGFDQLPTLTHIALPLAPYTPWFALGTIPAALVLVSRSLRQSQAENLVWLSAGALAVFLMWILLLVVALYFPIYKMGAIV